MTASYLKPGGILREIKSRQGKQCELKLTDYRHQKLFMQQHYEA